MGSNAAISTELQHLWTASHALSSINPFIAAHLMSQFFSLADTTGTSITPADRRTACSACGTLRIPGITALYRTRSNRPKKRQQRAPRIAGDETTPTDQMPSQMICVCKICRTETVEDVPNRPKVKRKRPQAKVVMEDEKMEEAGTVGTEWVKAMEAAEPPKPAQAKSRKKNKKGGSLSALLAKEKEKKPAAATGGFGLDFMDFMKM
ncbi:hypothetical protein EX30DRAFT_394263 [Ascodesmis nigricans]|uniref:Rpr2-domain-containing protein n=1 Tax=Ascodesmis nigricans TaxID=341454 RepID=A0A4V3SJ86_9PEZI|nr:hypothetical protein EX30DRAFT_394263 [Ascodesmis nigricans]